MSNSLQDYQSRTPGLSPDFIRDHIIATYSQNWEGRALDLGTGRGGFVRKLLSSKKFDSVDCMDIVDCREDDLKELSFSLTDLAKDRFDSEDNTYNFVFATEVIEHIENPRHFLREIHRVLKPNGSFIMSTPSIDSIRSKLCFAMRGYFPPFCENDYKDSGHITPVSMIDFERMCDEAGFKKIKHDFSLPGRMPKSSFEWQRPFPFLKGKNFSDCFISIVSK